MRLEPNALAFDSNGKRLYVALDTSMLWNTYCIVRLSVIYRGRAIPLVWCVLAHGSATVAYDSATLTATLRPTAPLQPATSYQMGLSGSIKDLQGNSLAWTTWSFQTTASETYSPARSLKFAAGSYTGYRFSSAGAVLASKAYTLTSGSSAPTTRRAAIAAHSGGWYYVASGVWAGYWMREGTGITLG